MKVSTNLNIVLKIIILFNIKLYYANKIKITRGAREDRIMIPGRVNCGNSLSSGPTFWDTDTNSCVCKESHSILSKNGEDIKCLGSTDDLIGSKSVRFHSDIIL